MSNQNPEPYLFKTINEQGQEGTTTSYGIDEQDAQSRFLESDRYAEGMTVQSLGLDPDYRRRRDAMASATPNLTPTSPTQYYGQPNPFSMNNNVFNMQNLPLQGLPQRPTGEILPFTSALDQTQMSRADILYGLRSFAPPPSTSRSVNMGLVQQGASPFDAGGMAMNQQRPIDQYLMADAGGMGGQPAPPDVFYGYGDPDGTGGFAPPQPQQTIGQQLNTVQYTNELKRQILNAIGMNDLNNNRFNRQYRDPNSALNRLGITQQDIDSNDPAVLQEVANKLITGNYALLENQSGLFPNPQSALQAQQSLNNTLGNLTGTTPDQFNLQTFDPDALPPAQATTEEAEQQASAINPGDINEAFDIINRVRQGESGLTLPENIVRLGLSGEGIAGQILNDFANAQRLQTPFGRAEAEEQRQMDFTTQIQIPTAEIQGSLDKAGLEQEGANYRAQIGFASDQMQVQSNERIANANNRSAEFIAQATNQSREYIAEVSANASRDVAQINGLSAQQVALINTRSAAEVAEITGLTQRDVERIKGDIQSRIATDTNLSKERIAQLQTDAQRSAADAQRVSAETIATANNMSAEKIAGASNLTQEEIVKIQTAAQEKIAKANNTSAEKIAQLVYSEEATSLRTTEFENLKEIERIKKEYAVELARLTDTEAIQIAKINNQAQEDLQKAQLQFEKDKYNRELEEAGAIQAAERERLQFQFLGGYQSPEEFRNAQIEINRGGLSAEDDKNLRALLAAGGLTAEERLAEIRAESRSAEMNAFIALLSNPQALGAFVTAISGQLPFEAVPTMGQLAEMTPNRIEYLQGALSAIGIDPQTFVRMAQDVTPQAFQETGPFGQLSAMIS